MLGVTAAFGEEVAAEPENLEGALRKMAAGLRGRSGSRRLRPVIQAIQALAVME